MDARSRISVGWQFAWKEVVVVAAALVCRVALPGESGRLTPVADQPNDGTSHAMILVGLPGDREHEALFTATARQWRGWLVDRLGFKPGNVHVFYGKSPPAGPGRHAGTHEAIVQQTQELKKSLGKQDSLWVFVLGHANDDGQHAWLHLPGPDLRDDEMAKLLEGIDCRQQVFWITTAASGRFLKSLSAKGRVVIAASAAEEDNETEFPHALADVVQRPIEQLDADQDGRVSVLELGRHVAAAVQARYETDRRAATEHAQLDDNGDGAGTAIAPASKPEPQAGQEKAAPPADGGLASRIYLPYRSSPPRRP